MSEGQLPLGAGGFLICVGILADGMKFFLDLLFGIGLILDPFLISPLTWLIFWITLRHYDIPMMSGKRGAAGWANLIIAEIPGIDAIPDWTIYAFYLTFSDRTSNFLQGIMHR